MESGAYLFSIHPQFSNKILLGLKRFEYRRLKAKVFLPRMIIYATSPISTIVGEVAVDKVIGNYPSEIWRLTQEYSGLTQEDFGEYFKGKKLAYAYCLSNPKSYSTYVDLKEIGIAAPPQSFVYISQKQISIIEKAVEYRFGKSSNTWRLRKNLCK